MTHHPFWTIPNLLSLSRVPLAVVLFVCITHECWAVGLGIFALAALTDWLDGWWARRYGPLSFIGRSLDPLTDKVLVCGAFIYLMADPRTGVLPWMVTVVVCREVLVTGLRGIVESTGRTFGADWFGKLKTVLQGTAIAAVLATESLRSAAESNGHLAAAEWIRTAILYAALVATVGSGLQYLFKAAQRPRS